MRLMPFILLIISCKCFMPEPDPNYEELCQFYWKYFNLTKVIHIMVLNVEESEVGVLIQQWIKFFNYSTVEIVWERGLETTISRTVSLAFKEAPEIIRKSNFSNTISQNYQVTRKYSSEFGKGHLIIARNLEVIQASIPCGIITNSRQRYAIILLNKTPPSLLGNLLLQLWEKFRVANVIAQTIEETDIFIYKPFEKLESTWGNVWVTDFTTLKTPELITNSVLDLNNYTLNARLFERAPTCMLSMPKNLEDNHLYKDLSKSGGYIGLDATVLAELARQMNFSVFNEPNPIKSFGRVLPNGTITGTLGAVVHGMVDIGANGFFLSDYQTHQIESTTIYFYDRICILTPKSLRIPQWMAVFGCFHWTTWTLLLGIIFISPLILAILNLQKVKYYYAGEALMVLLSMPVKTRQRGLFLASLLLFNVIIVGIFQGNLVKSFSTVSYFAEIDSLEDVDKSGLYISTSLSVFSNSSESPLIRSLAKKKVVLYEHSIKQVAYYRNVIALERRRDAGLFKLVYTSKDGVSLLHVAQACPIGYYITFIVPKNSPFLRRFNCLIVRFFESGLVQKWYDDLVDSITIHLKFENPENVKIQKPFSLYDIQSAFLIWIVGIFLSSITLICELFVHKIKIFIKMSRKSRRE